MFDGLLDGYTRSLLIFAGINVIAAYSFYPVQDRAGVARPGRFHGDRRLCFGDPDAEVRHAVRRGMIAGSLVAGVVGVAVGFPALRIKGIYLLLLTLGFSEIISVIALSWEYVGGAQGFRNISFNPFTLEYVIGIVTVLILFFASLERSSLGRAWIRSIRTKPRPK